ncbi:MAG: acyl-CoA dehydrogenase, partial [Deltaproteobacteria bacterium]
PKYRVNDDGSLGGSNDVQTGNIEHKMGIHGNSTCTLLFGENGGCVGELFGKQCEGLKVMFQMMNEARLGVGMQALGVASASYERALQYAKERIQSVPVWEMKNPEAKSVAIIEHPDVRRDLMWMKSRVEAFRALLLYTSLCLDLAESTEDKAEHDKWFGMAELLIPVCKAWVSDNAMNVCSKGMDVLGGYGFCAEYPLEQYMRDCKITTIYEGTNGIQSLDLVGRKLGSKKGANIMNLAGDILGTIGKAKENEELKKYAAFLEEAGNAVMDLALTFGQLGKSASFMLPILNASVFMDIFGDVVAGHFLMQAALIADEKVNVICKAKGADSIGKRRALVHSDKDVAFYEGKIASAKFFAQEALSTVKARCEAVKFGDKTPIEIADESFSA